jgi:hypothetical protein
MFRALIRLSWTVPISSLALAFANDCDPAQHGGGDTVLFDQFNDNSDFFFDTFGGQRLAFNAGEDAVAITDDFGAVNKAAVHTTTISNFVVVGSNPGVNDDIVSFSPDSWSTFGGGNGLGGFYFGLVNGDLSNVQEVTFANMALLSGSNNTLLANTNVAVYDLGGFSGTLAQLEHAITQTSGGAFNFAVAPGDENSFDFLIAYNNGSGVSIADIQFEAEGNGTSTFGFDIQAGHNLVTLTGVALTGTGSLFSEYLAHHSNIFFND